MTQHNWLEVLGWGTEHLQGLRFAGFSLLRQGHYEPAILYFKALAILEKSNAYDQQTLGALYLQIGKNEEALEQLDRALLLDPGHEPSLLNKTKALLMMGRKPEAFMLAKKLQISSHPTIANDASALVLAYS